MNGEWYVLVETAGGTTERWSLKRKVPAKDGRAEALARAEEICRTYAPIDERGLTTGKRTIFELSETSWLVEGRSAGSWASWHFRVSVGRTVWAK